jgi:hypothetical protein
VKNDVLALPTGAFAGLTGNPFLLDSAAFKFPFGRAAGVFDRMPLGF